MARAAAISMGSAQIQAIVYWSCEAGDPLLRSGLGLPALFDGERPSFRCGSGVKVVAAHQSEMSTWLYTTNASFFDA
jgi:hypothetical protein